MSTFPGTPLVQTASDSLDKADAVAYFAKDFY